MDNGFDEGDFDESFEGMDSGPRLGGFGDFSSGFSGGMNPDRQKDIKSINDRGKNEEIRHTDEDYGKTSSADKKRKKENDESDDITGEKKGKGSDELDSTKTKGEKGSSDDKESSDGKKDDKKEDKKDDKDDKKDDKKEKDGASSSDDKGDGFLKGKIKAKLTKYKIYLIIAGVLVGIFALVFIFLVIMTAIDNLTLGIVNFFGVPETDTGGMPGLYTDDKYRYDENGNLMNREELIEYLEKNSSCSGNFWTSIADGWNALWGNSIREACELIRYVTEQCEKTGVDEALIVSTIFYGYDTRPKAELYINPQEAPEVVDTVEHYQSLTEILKDKSVNIKRSDIDTIIKYSHAIHKTFYYEWVITAETNDDDEVTSVTGSCVYRERSEDKYNLDKWKIFMRFGEKVADKFEEVVLTERNYESSSDECKNEDGYSNEALLEQVKNAAAVYGDDVGYSVDFSSVKKARKELTQPEEGNSDLFYQAADTMSKTKDVFQDYNGLEFDYKNGYAYRKFPSYKPSMEPGGYYYGKVKIQYDDIFTPKEVEQLIQSILGRKKNMNGALLRDDPDTEDDYIGSLRGYSGVPTGANCMQYLTASLSDIKVKLTDCYGTYLDTVSFEDYIIGVANGEVSNSNDDYVLSEMVAAISYALNRRNNYTKGDTIEMKSGTCDQVYCSMLRGCNMKHTPVGTCDICNSYYIGGSKKSPELYPKYQALYEIASDYLLIKDDEPFAAHYVSTIQNRWYDKASQGMSFTQIMQEEYGDEGATLIRCSDPNETSPDLPEEPEEKVGNKPTSEYPNVAPDLGPYYGFSYKDGSDNTHITINPEWKDANLVTISPECEGNSEYASKTFTVNKSAVSNFEKAFKNVCKILTKGVKISNGKTCNYTVDDIMDGTVFIERKTSGGTVDLHAYGLAQDINYSKKFVIDGKEYTPYNTRDLSEYLAFVNAIGGKEESCQNVNYILWAYAYKDAGFFWGGNYGRNGNSGTYDGKVFEIKYK